LSGYAHDLYPLPTCDVPVEGAALATLQAHAAAAQGLWLAAADPDGAWAVDPMLHEWRLARTWCALISGADPDTAATTTAESADDPARIGPEIWVMCDSCGVDPAQILPSARPEDGAAAQVEEAAS